MREEKIHKIEVHAAGICFDGDKVLVAKRSSQRKLFPDLWECGGGQIEAGENFEQAVLRQLKQELGIIAEPVKLFNTYEILTPNSEQKKIPGIKFICRIKGFKNNKEPQISEEHSEWKWQPIDGLDKLEFIPGLKEDIKIAYSEYKRQK